VGEGSEGMGGGVSGEGYFIAGAGLVVHAGSAAINPIGCQAGQGGTRGGTGEEDDAGRKMTALPIYGRPCREENEVCTVGGERDPLTSPSWLCVTDRWVTHMVGSTCQ
jgi:hypothetical protein